MKTHQRPRADEFQTRFNIDECLIADRGRNPTLPVPWEGHRAASNQGPACSIGVIWVKTTLYFLPFCGTGQL